MIKKIKTGHNNQTKTVSNKGFTLNVNICKTFRIKRMVM